MTSASVVTGYATRRPGLLPLGIALLAVVSYAAGVITPSIIGSLAISPAHTTTVTAAQPRQGPPDDQLPGAQVQSRQGPPDDQIPAGRTQVQPRQGPPDDLVPAAKP